jgi:hypothetical protein
MDIKENTLSINEDKKSISSIKSTKKSSLGSKKSSKKVSNKIDIESDDISLTQLELLANKKKLNAPDQVSIIEKKDSSIEEVKRPKVSVKTSSSSVSSSSSSSDSTKHKLRKEKVVQRENRNDSIRKEKSEFLCKFNKINVKGKWSSLKLDMNCSLDEIRNEYERVRNEIQTERSVGFFKRMLLLGVQGIEMMNNRFDPLGVDLDGWSEAMGYSMENQEYDEVMAELYEKYKGRGQMSPEVKLIFMIISSATMFTISKKITKMDSSNAFASLIGNLVGKNNGNQATPPNQYTQEYSQNQQYNQQQYNQHQQQYNQHQQQYNQHQQQYNQQYIPNPSELNNYRKDVITETTDDIMPSKMKDPGNIQDDIDLNNILKTMKERKREKERQEITETSDDILKSIQMNQKRGRGRPRKANNSLRMM